LFAIPDFIIAFGSPIMANLRNIFGFGRILQSWTQLHMRVERFQTSSIFFFNIFLFLKCAILASNYVDSAKYLRFYLPAEPERPPPNPPWLNVWVEAPALALKKKINKWINIPQKLIYLIEKLRLLDCKLDCSWLDQIF
jgi:hypothetical protein